MKSLTPNPPTYTSRWKGVPTISLLLFLSLCLGWPLAELLPSFLSPSSGPSTLLLGAFKARIHHPLDDLPAGSLLSRKVGCNPMSLSCACLEVHGLLHLCPNGTAEPPHLEAFDGEIRLDIVGSWAKQREGPAGKGVPGTLSWVHGPHSGRYACRRGQCHVRMRQPNDPSTAHVQLFTGMQGGGISTPHSTVPFFLVEGAAPPLHPRALPYFSGVLADASSVWASGADVALAPTFAPAEVFLEPPEGYWDKKRLGDLLLTLPRPPWSGASPPLPTSPLEGAPPPPQGSAWAAALPPTPLASSRAAVHCASEGALRPGDDARACVLRHAFFLACPPDGGVVECVWEALAAGVVPVVPYTAPPYGADPHSPLHDLPREAAVWEDDFVSHEELHAHLAASVASESAYAAHFAWKSSPSATRHLQDRLQHSYATAVCDACDLAVEHSHHIFPLPPSAVAGFSAAGRPRLQRCVAERLLGGAAGLEEHIQRHWLPVPEGGVADLPVYVIARSDSKRLPGLRERLQAVGLGAHLVVGFDKKSMSEADLACWGAAAEGFDPGVSKTFYPSSSEISHGAASAAALLDIYQSGVPGLLIEDDIMFLEGFKEDLAAIRAAIDAFAFPEDRTVGGPGASLLAWDLAWLSCFEAGEKWVASETGERVYIDSLGCPPEQSFTQCRFADNVRRFNLTRPFDVEQCRAHPEKLFVQGSGSAGGAAYLASPRGAAKLLNGYPMHWPQDHQINYVNGRDWMAIIHPRACRVMEMQFAILLEGLKGDGSETSVLGEDRKNRPPRRIV